jgi:hypothetical protein
MRRPPRAIAVAPGLARGAILGNNRVTARRRRRDKQGKRTAWN